MLRKEDSVLIPIKEKQVSQEIEEFNYNIITFYFDEVKRKRNSIREILVDKLPQNVHELIPTAFDVTGNIAVIDIKDEMMEYSKDIGESIMELNPSIESVFRKSSKVDGLYRIRGLELISGKNNTVTIHREHGLRFQIDLAKTYFSPRLATEHDRVARLVREDEKILDMFCGVAPFAFHILKLVKARCICIDINPNVEDAIQTNMALNRSLNNDLEVIIGDVREVMDPVRYQKYQSFFDRIIMNHPSAAIDFLDQALQLISPNGTIYLYSFVPNKKTEEYCKSLLKKFSVKIMDIVKVRQSSPSELHVCIELMK